MSAGTTNDSTIPRWFRVVAVAAVAWMLLGVVAWFMDFLMGESAIAGMSEAQRQLYLARPGWLFVLYGIAVGSGLAGAVGLLLRRRWAVPAFALSLAAAVVQFGYLFIAMDAIAHMGFAAAVPFPAAVMVIGVALLWLSRSAARRGWLGPAANAAGTTARSHTAGA